tara:strand:- start:2762 stop:3460 length:699 start_codon:yes stop_codon:yes gene_type:complete
MATEGNFKHPDTGVRLGHSGFDNGWVNKYLPEVDITCILDIGSFDGGDSIRFNQWYPEAKVYSIEAAPINFEVLTRNLVNRESVELFNLAFSNTNGKLVLNQLVNSSLESYGMVMGSLYENIQSKISQHGMSFIETVEVQSITFDSFCEKNNITNVDVAHVDIEGASYAMVCGMNKVLPKLIYTEQQGPQWYVGDHATNEDLHELLDSKGYTLVETFPNDFLYVHKDYLNAT